MKRIQAFEFNERQECPRFLRDAVVEILGKAIKLGKIFDPVAPLFKEFCQRTNNYSFIDLCSGTGEPLTAFVKGMQQDKANSVCFTASDLFPKVHAMKEVVKEFPDNISMIYESIDATDVPENHDRPGRTIINAFHHFSTDMAQKIIQDSVQKRRAIFILEAFPRDFKCFLAFFPMLTLSFLINPFLTQKDRLTKLIFSFLIPIIPIIGTFDGFISVCRIHDKEELMKMVEPYQDVYDWEYHQVPFSKWGKSLVFVGIPKG
ncbi:conserved hypothetical protein, membrane [Candidatus Magnetomorum sp. HK-1]|nr:conserved hypothetical protein, membrane [Candidatus Magnetomorum sp. HK-1]